MPYNNTSRISNKTAASPTTKTDTQSKNAIPARYMYSHETVERNNGMWRYQNESSNDKVDQMLKTEDIAKYSKESKQHQQNIYI